MKRKIIVGLSLFFLLLLPDIVRAETIILSTDKDTYIDKMYPDVNFGQKWNALVSGSPASKLANGLFHFDVTALPDTAIIKDAKLTFLVHANHATTKYFIHPLSTFWQEDAATWNLAETGINWVTPGGDYDSAVFIETALPGTAPQWMVTDVTSLVCDQQGYIKQGIAEKGLLLRGDAGYSKILSSEFSTYANAQTCHSCHGTNDPSRDVGKSTNCAQCHSREDISLCGRADPDCGL